MSKHARGPWTVLKRDRNANGSLQLAITNDYGSVAWAVERPQQFGDADTNAQLIAAAPDQASASSLFTCGQRRTTFSIPLQARSYLVEVIARAEFRA